MHSLGQRGRRAGGLEAPAGVAGGTATWALGSVQTAPGTWPLAEAQPCAGEDGARQADPAAWPPRLPSQFFQTQQPPPPGHQTIAGMGGSLRWWGAAAPPGPWAAPLPLAAARSPRRPPPSVPPGRPCSSAHILLFARLNTNPLESLSPPPAGSEPQRLAGVLSPLRLLRPLPLTGLWAKPPPSCSRGGPMLRAAGGAEQGRISPDTSSPWPPGVSRRVAVTVSRGGHSFALPLGQSSHLRSLLFQNQRMRAPSCTCSPRSRWRSRWER